MPTPSAAAAAAPPPYRIWRPSEDLEDQIQEGQVYSVTSLTAKPPRQQQQPQQQEGPPLRWGLDLSTTKGTRWQLHPPPPSAQVTPAAAAAGEEVTATAVAPPLRAAVLPRTLLRLGNVDAAAATGRWCDFTGVLLGASKCWPLSGGLSLHPPGLWRAPLLLPPALLCLLCLPSALCPPPLGLAAVAPGPAVPPVANPHLHHIDALCPLLSGPVCDMRAVLLPLLPLLAGAQIGAAASGCSSLTAAWLWGTIGGWHSWHHHRHRRSSSSSRGRHSCQSWSSRASRRRRR